MSKQSQQSQTVSEQTEVQITSVNILSDEQSDMRALGELLTQVRNERVKLAQELVQGNDITRLFDAATQVDKTVYKTFATPRHASAHAMYKTLSHAVEALLSCDAGTEAYSIAWNTCLSVARHMVAVGPSTVSKDARATSELRAFNAVLGAMHRVPVMTDKLVPQDVLDGLNKKAQARGTSQKVASSNLAGVLDSAPEDALK